jgi:hypothetical protein
MKAVVYEQPNPVSALMCHKKWIAVGECIEICLVCCQERVIHFWKQVESHNLLSYIIQVTYKEDETQNQIIKGTMLG